METKNRLIPDALDCELGRVEDYSFFQLNALLQQFRRVYNQTNEKPLDIRYRALASLGFPASDIASCHWLEEVNKEFVELTVSFMGLYGPASPLPAYYTERVLQSSDPKHPSRDLMDLFNHRLISLLQICWEKYRYFVRYETNGDDHYSQWLLALAGVDQSLLKNHGCLKWHRLLPLAGVLAGANGSADCMSKVIAHYFGIPKVEFEPWVARKIEVPRLQCNAMGMKNTRLGSDLVVGDQIQDCMGKFHIHLKGIDTDLYRAFLPGGTCFDELVELMQLLMVDPFDYEFWLHPAQSVSSDRDGAGGLELGWNLNLGQIDDGSNVVEPVRICVTDYRSI